MEAVLEFDNVTFGYINGGKRQDILKDTSIYFEKGVFYTIIGPSGSGKTTTLARALASDADVILADEPTGNLDINTAREIIAIFKELAHVYNKCVIVVSHSKEVADESDVSYQFEVTFNRFGEDVESKVELKRGDIDHTAEEDYAEINL